MPIPDRTDEPNSLIHNNFKSGVRFEPNFDKTPESNEERIVVLKFFQQGISIDLLCK